MKNTDLNILIVEDEIIAREYLLSILQSLGFSNLQTSSNMKDSLEIVKKNHIDLVFMDINIEGSIDGISCARILNQEYFIPIIFASAYNDDQTIQEASETNIFGYLIKPFEKAQVNIALLMAIKKIEASKISNKKKGFGDELFLGKGQKYNILNKTFFVNSQPINLTKKENDILYVLCQNFNHNISYETLKKRVWPDKDISNSTVRDTVSRLKKKTPNLNIETIVNFGYILKI